MRLLLEHALLENGVESGVLLEVEGGWIKTVGVLGQSMTFSGEASADNVRFPRLAVTVQVGAGVQGVPVKRLCRTSRVC